MTDASPIQQELVELALMVAEGEGQTLDFSAQSVATVESILGFLHDRYTATGDTEGV